MPIPAELSTGTWNIDNSHSEIGFSVRHAGISKVRGRFSDVEGTLQVAEEVAKSQLQAVVQTASVDTRDENRDAHLKGEDFFNVEQFPTMTFAGKDLVGQGNEFTLHGDLTIRGTTQPVEFDVEFQGTAVDPFGLTRAGFEATTTISRKEFGLTWNAALEAGGVLVGDKVTIILDLSLVKAEG
ncbi:YceI family protein [Zhihengliuella flava]|uniref:Polyisoprenoid-binding protein YceI n=1 Tax=Zhihengliuella flava TaxID=1285193 RepID=A0A931GL55_9MICC|nr:YceI family protein [Zhihengliuella flava]MBG6084139.1 polyisoprenoid-binding protein YceI [Zhihengliuella flava]